MLPNTASRMKRSRAHLQGGSVVCTGSLIVRKLRVARAIKRLTQRVGAGNSFSCENVNKTLSSVRLYSGPKGISILSVIRYLLARASFGFRFRHFDLQSL
ncbi:hypothetical protein V1477_010664 [Vespula maculifrons]|uniref:Uncharacterized protein n=1 Tax=Vespula maculifrons TaxID=7453 RepID=A0ABD2C2L2_VESMC